MKAAKYSDKCQILLTLIQLALRYPVLENGATPLPPVWAVKLRIRCLSGSKPADYPRQLQAFRKTVAPVKL